MCLSPPYAGGVGTRCPWVLARVLEQCLSPPCAGDVGTVARKVMSRHPMNVFVAALRGRRWHAHQPQRANGADRVLVAALRGRRWHPVRRFPVCLTRRGACRRPARETLAQPHRRYRRTAPVQCLSPPCAGDVGTIVTWIVDGSKILVLVAALRGRRWHGVGDRCSVIPRACLSPPCAGDVGTALALSCLLVRT